MAAKTKMSFILIGMLLLAGVVTPVSAASYDHILVRGIVDSVDEDVLTIDGHRYDIAGATVLNADGTAAEKGGSLRGNVVDILYRKGKIVSVRVSPPVPM